MKRETVSDAAWRPGLIGVRGLALLAALFLAPDAARAQIAACTDPGAMPAASGTHDCTPAEAANGIVYSGANGLTLTVGAGSIAATTITRSAAGGTNMQESGIVIVNAGATTATDDGSISLTMGATGGVSIVQPTPTAPYTTLPASSGHGIYIRPSAPAAASSLVVDLKSGVRIGTQAAPMLHDGVHTRIDSTTHTGSHTITSAARIYATGDGIELAHDGAGKVMLINSGDVLSTAGSGILVRTAAGNTADVRIDMTGGSVTSNARPPDRGAVRADLNGAGDAVATVSEGAALVSQYGPGLHVALGSTAATGRIRVTQAGTISARRGVVAHVARESAAGETRAADDQPAIDVAWTGTFAREAGKTEASDSGRFAVTGIDRATVVTHRGAVGERVTRYGQAAGIEAGLMRLDPLLATVAKGDDPNALMSREAQQALLAVAVLGEAAPDDMDRARAAVIVRQFRALLTDTNFAQPIPGAAGIDSNGDERYSAQEITDYLTADDAERRTFLRNLLLDGLSEGEEAVIAALTTGGDLEAALDDLPDYGSAYAAYGDSWKDEVRAFLDWHNIGNIRLAVNGGAIASRGDGIRAWYAIPNDDNGRIDVTVAEGARVTGGMAGIHVANAGCPVDDGCVPGEAGIRDQTVTVHGRVMGGTDAAVHLSGGGFLTVGRTGQLLAGSSGQAILVNDPGPARIHIDGLVRGGTGARAAVDLTGGGSVTIGVTGRVEANGAMSAIRGDEDTDVTLHADRDPREIQDWISRESADGAATRVEGLIVGAGTTATTFKEFQDGVTTGHEATVPLKEGRPDTSGLRCAVYPGSPDPSGRRCPNPPDPPDPPDPRDSGGEDMGGTDPDDRPPPGTGQLPPPPMQTFDCDGAMDGRCRLYEALPSFLLAMNGLPDRDDRLTAGRDANGAWARIDVAHGKWKADSSTTRPDLAYDRRRHGAQAGIDAEVADGARVGVSVHGLRGAATLSGAGKADLSGAGAGVYATVQAGGGFHLDAQAAATWYEVDLTSAIHRSRPLANDVSGTGYAWGVEVGRSVAAAPDVSLTPRVGLVWSRASLADFTDSVGSRCRVSVERAKSLRARVGAEASLGGSGNGRMFAALYAVHEFSAETETVVEGRTLKASAEPTSLHFGLGGSFGLDERTSLRVAMGYETSGSGNRAFNLGLKLGIRF